MILGGITFAGRCNYVSGSNRKQVNGNELSPGCGAWIFNISLLVEGYIGTFPSARSAVHFLYMIILSNQTCSPISCCRRQYEAHSASLASPAGIAQILTLLFNYSYRGTVSIDWSTIHRVNNECVLRWDKKIEIETKTESNSYEALSVLFVSN